MRATGKTITIAVLFIILSLVLSGCSSGSAVEFEVEKVEKEGKNLYPLKREVLEDVKENVNIWIKHPERIKEAFTGTALSDFNLARALDKKEGVKRVRVHEDQKFTVMDLHNGERPEVEYKFFDKSYFVDAKTGKPKTRPYNKERTLTIFLVREGNKWKIDNIVGLPEAIR
ncbi:MAG: ARC6/PARC6 family protein [Actinobacteria bacterium]|nr:ARC6/PARC6 family protein [Actinomycetota bacterium]